MWDDFEVNAEGIPKYKLLFHSFQIIFAFVLWCLEIAVFRHDSAKITGRNGWTFAMPLLTIPAWIYLTMAPRHSRTRKIANPRVMVTVDALYTILWLSAFATQASYNSAGFCGKVCGISKAIVGLGFFVFLFFGVTTFISIWTLKYWEMYNRLPGYDRVQSKNQNIDPDKAAFSLAPHDEEAYAPVSMDDDHEDGRTDYTASTRPPAPRSDYSDPYGPGGAASTVGSSYRDNPFRQHQASSPFDVDTEYHSGRASAAGGRYGSPAPGAVSEVSYADSSQPVRFPDADYDRIAR